MSAQPATGPTPVEFAGAGGVRIAGDRSGDLSGPPVVLLHGGGQTRQSWRRTAEGLADAGWCAYTVDLRGHGDSGWPDDGDYRAEAFAGDVAAVASSLPSPPVLIGASLGGVTSLLAVGELGAAARGLVLVDVAPRIEQAGTDRITSFMLARAEEGFASLEEAADAIAAYNPHRPRPADLSGLGKNLRRRPDGRWRWHWDPRFMRGPSGGTDETRMSLVDPERLESAARAVRAPILLVRGRQSDLLSEEGARLFLAVVPDASYADVAGAGHMIAGDRNDAFNDAILPWLEALAER
ncbi:alpha/beta hydrolase [Acidiferrimicrobium sp. IK]|uniref:alpha/beta fold hydrolase n=1 Tax=Acidiferrimicrobium sp. IK TaxID=2871700 RepID=UPI0021CB5F28|nr:alpha/beta hydrolase [Acidiferrimicrobium sp. IK]MCU4184484.1 alpha/beta hydrolase [Acidiferrimicrobium sp. IK]